MHRAGPHPNPPPAGEGKWRLSQPSPTSGRGSQYASRWVFIPSSTDGRERGCLNFPDSHSFPLWGKAGMGAGELNTSRWCRCIGLAPTPTLPQRGRESGPHPNPPPAGEGKWPSPQPSPTSGRGSHYASTGVLNTSRWCRCIGLAPTPTHSHKCEGQSLRQHRALVPSPVYGRGLG